MSGRPLPGTFDDPGRPPLRYRRFGGGYRREDVDLLLAEFRLTLRAVELEVGTLRDRGRELEERLRDARSEIDAFHSKTFELAQATTAARERAARADNETKARVDALVAEGQAEAQRQIAEAQARVEELNAQRDRLVSEMRELVSRVGATIGEAPADEPEPDELRPLEDGFPGKDLSSLREHASTRVELDAGPFADFEALAGFERQLADLEDVEDVYVRDLSGDRVTIELTVASGSPLLANMQEQMPYELEIRDRSLDRLVIDVAAGA
jgi:chromosome segregation ATPase